MRMNYGKIKRCFAAGLAVLLLLSGGSTALAEAISAIVTGSSLPVYADSALSSPLGTLPENTVVQVMAYTGDVARIAYDGRTGYASSVNLTAVEAVAQKALMSQDALVFQRATTDSRSAKVKAGTRVYVLATVGNWAQIEKNGIVAYTTRNNLVQANEQWQAEEEVAQTIDMDSMPEVFEASSTTQTTIPATVTASSVKVYQKASTKSKKLGTLKKGQQVEVVKYNSKWAYIALNGKYGYCSVKALTQTSALNTPTPSPTPTPAPQATTVGQVSVSALKVYQKASTKSKKLGTLKKGQQVNVISWTSSWAYIEMNGRYGFCSVKGLKRPEAVTPDATLTPAPTATPTPDASAAKDAVVSVESLKVYQSADTASQVLGTLSKGRAVRWLATMGDWAYIELNGSYGYCAAASLTDAAAVTPTPTPAAPEAIQGTVSVSSVKVYQKASTSSKSLGTLKKGQVVNVRNVSGSWAEIELNGNVGYVKTSALSLGAATPTPTPTPATPSMDMAVTATVTAKTTVYQRPDTTSKKLGTLKKNVEVKAVKYDDNWAYVERNGSYGYCPLSALSQAGENGKLPSGYKAGEFTATVIDPTAMVYASATTGAQSASLTLGSSVDVLAYSDSWAVIRWNGTMGYVPIKNLSRAAYVQISGNGSEVETLSKALLVYGYYDAEPTTSLSSAAVTTAIKRFQAACGLAETGTADITLMRILYGGYAPKSAMLAATLSRGDNGEKVSRLQARLYALGYLSKTASLDGDYGTTTANAVGLFQSANNISSTGIADTATLKAMYAIEAKSLPSGSKAADATTTTTKSNSTYLDNVPKGLASTTSSYSSSMSNLEKLEYVIFVAQNQLGKPYVYGAAGTKSYDCSGLTSYCFKQVGVSLKRSAYNQGYDSGYTKIEGVSSLRRGDLVFFNTISDSDLSDHVGVYLGGGYFIHASSGGHRVVVSNLTSGYYNRVYSWGRRILN